MLTGCVYGHDHLTQAAAEGVELMRTEGPETGDVAPYIDQLLVQGGDLPFVFTLHRADRIYAYLDALMVRPSFRPRAGFYVFNELERGTVDAPTYVAGVTEVYQAVRAAGLPGRVVAGGLLNLSKESLAFYAQVLPLLPRDTGPEGLSVSFHDYPNGNQAPWRTHPYPGIGSYDQALQQLIGLAAGREVGCGEVGWHTWPETAGIWPFKHPVQLTDDQCHDFLVADYRRYAPHLAWACAYQWQDDPRFQNSQARFGLHLADGVTPKRQAAALLDWR